jgi:hypothetical protein
MSQARVFQCPNCREFISADATSCRFCSTPIDAQTAQLAADAQAADNKRYRKKQYARHMLLGGGVFSLGFAITVATLIAAVVSEGGGHYLITWGLMLAGGGDFLYGLLGWLSELKKEPTR